MRLIDADELCSGLLDRWKTADENKEELIKHLIADVVTPIVVSTPTVDVFDKIWNEIEELQQDILKSSETSLDSTYNISIGISMALGIIRKYMKGRY